MMIAQALISSSAHPDIPAEDRIFEPLIGEWDLRITWYEGGQAVREEAGEWIFARVLEGRAIQDVWIVPPRARRADPAALYEYGTSIRYYEPAERCWRSTWIGPMNAMVRTFRAERRGETIMLETAGEDDGALRWIFSEISADAFLWQNFVRSGGEWRLQQDFKCRRRR